ncbi:MAG: hypothetical protein KDB03_16900 [Planctomycetales bacterium]|nr:hypothetical protein [Planctomycetales bacterium]
MIRQVSIVLGCCSLIMVIGCTKRHRDATQTISQRLAEQQTKTDNLRNAMRFLSQLTPVNRQQAAKEVQLELNTWLESAPSDETQYSRPQLIQEIPADLLTVVGSDSPTRLQFGYWDVDYLFERRMMRLISEWVIGLPMHDSLLGAAFNDYRSKLGEADAQKLEETLKLFDWTIRNVVLAGETTSVEQKYSSPGLPIHDGGFGYGYLPWETLLFSQGDFVARGRCFTALADMRGIESFWIGLGDAEQPYLWAIGVLIGDEILVFDPKLGLPLLNPDTAGFATLSEAQSNERIMRRLNLPGQFEFVFQQADLKQITFLLDVVPAATSARMKLLETALLGDERMRLYKDVDALAAKTQARLPGASTKMWLVPTLAQIHAATIRERLETPSEFQSQYYYVHGVWLFDTPAAQARFKHLRGEFESTLDTKGALASYIELKVPDELINKLSYDPEVQKGLGVERFPGETDENFQLRILQSQMVYSRAKVDAAFLLAQLHFDRGKYDDAEKWLRDRVIKDERAVQWHAAAWYSLGRIYQETGNQEGLQEALTQSPNPQEPGNRLRLRYVSRKPQ